MTNPIDLARVFRAIGIRGAIAIALAVMLALSLWRIDHLADARDEALREAGAAETRHAATRASLEALERDLAAFVDEGALRRERAVAALVGAREAGDELRADAARAEAEGRTDWRNTEGL